MRSANPPFMGGGPQGQYPEASAGIIVNHTCLGILITAAVFSSSSSGFRPPQGYPPFQGGPPPGGQPFFPPPGGQNFPPPQMGMGGMNGGYPARPPPQSFGGPGIGAGAPDQSGSPMQMQMQQGQAPSPSPAGQPPVGQFTAAPPGAANGRAPMINPERMRMMGM